MFIDDPGVLHWHEPTAERDHFGAQLDVRVF
jgi:hypothetical protein